MYSIVCSKKVVLTSIQAALRVAHASNSFLRGTCNHINMYLRKCAYSSKPSTGSWESKLDRPTKREQTSSVFSHPSMREKYLERLRKYQTIAPVFNVRLSSPSSITRSIPEPMATTPTPPSPTPATAPLPLTTLPLSCQASTINPISAPASMGMVSNTSYDAPPVSVPLSPKPALKISRPSGPVVPSAVAVTRAALGTDPVKPTTPTHRNYREQSTPTNVFPKMVQRAAPEPKTESNFKTPDNKKFTDTINALQDELKRMREYNDTLLSKYKNSLSEAENMRIRLQKQINDTKIYGIQSICKDLLDVADILGKATDSVPKEQLGRNNYLKNLYEGLSATRGSMMQILKRYGLIEVTPLLNTKFDPNVHEAVFTRYKPGTAPDTIISVSKSGYKLHNRMIRPAVVVVAKDMNQ